MYERPIRAVYRVNNSREIGVPVLNILLLHFAPDRLQWVRNGLTLFTADDYNSKVLSERGGAGQRVGYTKTGLRASPNRITQNHYFTTYE